MGTKKFIIPIRCRSCRYFVDKMDFSGKLYDVGAFCSHHNRFLIEFGGNSLQLLSCPWTQNCKSYTALVVDHNTPRKLVIL